MILTMSGVVLVLLGFFVLVVGGVIVQGLVKIPAQPPTVFAVTFLGKRTGHFLSEGWKILPGYSWLFGGIPVQVEKRNLDLDDIPIWTPDLVPMKVKVALTWTPDREHLIDFLNSGGDDRIEDILTDIIAERVRVWAQSPFEGPENWTQAIAAKEEATAIVLKAILGDELTRIPAPFPTWLLLKYFEEPRRPPTTIREKEIGGANWENIDKYVSGLSLKQQKDLKARVEERRKHIQDARLGNGGFKKPYLGIVISRLNVKEIVPEGKVKDAADLPAKERLEREAEKIEVANIKDRLSELTAPQPAGPGFTPERAMEIIQTERGKVKKEIKETQLNISPETRQTIEKIANIIGTAIGKRG